MDFNCKSCGYSREIPDSYYGRKVRCPICKTKVRMSGTRDLGEATLRKPEMSLQQRLRSAMVKVTKEWSRVKEEREKAFEVRRRLEEELNRQHDGERQRLEEQEMRCNEEKVRLKALELRLKALEDGFCGFNENWQRAMDDLSQTRDMFGSLQQESQLIREETQSSFEEQQKRSDELEERLDLEIQKQQELQGAYHELEQAFKDTRERDESRRRLRTSEMEAEDHLSEYWNMRLEGGQTPREIYMMRQDFACRLKRLSFIATALFIFVFFIVYIFPQATLLHYITMASFVIVFVTVYVFIIRTNYRLAKALQKNVSVVLVISLLLVPAIAVYWWLMREASFRSPSKIKRLALYN
jgi:hypothetical protein